MVVMPVLILISLCFCLEALCTGGQAKALHRPILQNRLHLCNGLKKRHKVDQWNLKIQHTTILVQILIEFV